MFLFFFKILFIYFNWRIITIMWSLAGYSPGSQSQTLLKQLSMHALGAGLKISSGI